MADENNELSKQQIKQQRNISNNANNARAAADIAAQSANPYAKAAGTVVKAADKISGGKASEKIGKHMDAFMKSQGLKGKMMQAALNKMSESGASQRIAAASKKDGLNNSNQALKNAKGNLKTNDVSSSVGSSKREVHDEASDGGDASFKVTANVVKWGLIACAAAAPIIIFCCLIITSSQIYIKSIGLGSADSLSNQDVEDKINKKQEDSEDLSEEVTEDDLSYDIFIDDEKSITFRKHKLVKTATTYLKRKYNEADLDRLEDFYPSITNLSKNYDENMVYDFFFKMYNLYTTYRDTYKVELDLPLLMSTLNIQSSDMYVIFSSNLSAEDRAKTARKKPIAEFDYYYDWTGYITTPNQSTHDMEILAQNMVSEASKDACDSPVNDKCYIIDNDKYKEFLRQFIEKKYYLENEPINVITPSKPATGEWKTWKQCDPRWGDIGFGRDTTICAKGCLITSVTMQIVRSGTETTISPVDPGTASKKYAFTGNSFYYNSARNVAPNFVYLTEIPLAGMNKASIAKKLLSYDSTKYYMVLGVSKTSSTSSSHYVALDYVDPSNNEIYMMDPLQSEEPKLYSKYKVVSALVYEKRD